MYEDLSCLFAPLEATSEFGALTDALSRPGAALACGLDDAQKLHLTASSENCSRVNSPVLRPSHITMMRSAMPKSSPISLEIITMLLPSAASCAMIV